METANEAEKRLETLPMELSTPAPAQLPAPTLMTQPKTKPARSTQAKALPEGMTNHFVSEIQDQCA